MKSEFLVNYYTVLYSLQYHCAVCNFLLRPRNSSSHAPPSRDATRSTSLASVGATHPTSSSSAKATATKLLQSPTRLTDNLSGAHNHKRTGHNTRGGDGDEMEIRLDLDETVQWLEKEIDDVTIISPSKAAGGRGAVAIGGVESMRVDSFHDDDILPEAAEHMGSGTEYNEQHCNNGIVWFDTAYDHEFSFRGDDSIPES